MSDQAPEQQFTIEWLATVNCETCFFWHELGDSAGICQRFPSSQRKADPDCVGGFNWGQPIMYQDEWCGEWRDVFTFRPLAAVLVTPPPETPPAP